MNKRMADHSFNNGKWTLARFNSFIKGALRAASKRWGPINEARKQAWLERGVYRCAGYRKRWHKVPASILIDGKRKNNIFVDHISPIINPEEGFISWDTFIERLFCEVDNLQVLCKECHDRKSQDERKRRS